MGKLSATLRCKSAGHDRGHTRASGAAELFGIWQQFLLLHLFIESCLVPLLMRQLVDLVQKQLRASPVDLVCIAIRLLGVEALHVLHHPLPLGSLLLILDLLLSKVALAHQRLLREHFLSRQQTFILVLQVLQLFLAHARRLLIEHHFRNLSSFICSSDFVLEVLVSEHDWSVLVGQIHSRSISQVADQIQMG